MFRDGPTGLLFQWIVATRALIQLPGFYLSAIDGKLPVSLSPE
jgi:hypothetical protein